MQAILCNTSLFAVFKALHYSIVKQYFLTAEIFLARNEISSIYFLNVTRNHKFLSIMYVPTPVICQHFTKILLKICKY